MTLASVATSFQPVRSYPQPHLRVEAAPKGHAAARPHFVGDRRLRLSAYPVLVVLAAIFFLLPPATPAQDSKSQLRTVRGVVSEKSSESPVASAVVFLKNTRNNDVRSYISDPEGNYRFSGLDPNVDYEVHAEKDGAKSTTRTVSSFDSKKEIVLNLKLERKK
jgi:Carboxypeptidase regulatory-like domain